jgi:6-phosphogluconolactonase
MVRESLFARATFDAKRVHPIPTTPADPNEAALRYERELRSFFPDTSTTFDLAILGVGEDGHTASLFPGSPTLQEVDRWVVPVPESPQPPHLPRITLTLPVLNASRHAVILATGPAKATVVRRCLEPSKPPADRLPVTRVTGRESTTWLLDYRPTR